MGDCVILTDDDNEVSTRRMAGGVVVGRDNESHSVRCFAKTDRTASFRCRSDWVAYGASSEVALRRSGSWEVEGCSSPGQVALTGLGWCCGRNRRSAGWGREAAIQTARGVGALELRDEYVLSLSLSLAVSSGAWRDSACVRACVRACCAARLAVPRMRWLFIGFRAAGGVGLLFCGRP
ncbi:hypothetical protein LZ30DRAFT_89395 [Colletotrichum cereale]|nr:hypothetical protein LZ30DRAFT_89395 [Colletotrichum cereale]